jgi:hypothetical protein
MKKLDFKNSHLTSVGAIQTQMAEKRKANAAGRSSRACVALESKREES